MVGNKLHNQRHQTFVFLFVGLLFLDGLSDLALAKRGGWFGRGSSGSRSRTPGGGGGFFGGGSSIPGRSSSAPNLGATRYSGSKNRGVFGGGGGRRSGGIMSGLGRSRTASAIGRSSSRGNTVKNMLLGAAAGYFAYKGGKYLIKNLAAPMMYRNRPYYWGQQYYQPRPGYPNQCRAPYNSAEFGEVYTDDVYSSRPKELVWSCSPHEECCGHDCCPRGGGYGGGYGPGAAVGGGGGYIGDQYAGQWRRGRSSSSSSEEYYG